MLSTKISDSVRKRKAHKKSRHGCANCKIRGVKCDEAKPSCRRCDGFNVVCCYGSKFAPDSLLAKQSFQVHMKTTSQSVMQSPPAPLPISGSTSSLETYQLVARDVSLIERFQRCTVWTLGTRTTNHVYAAKILPLAFTNPLLMHVVLAMAEMHDLAMDAFGGNRRSYSLTYHWSNAVSSMRQYLHKSIPPSERDVLWISANMISLSYLAYNHIDERSPEDAWPLCPPSPSDLSWFTICDGQKVIAQLTNPMREDSAFCLPATEMCIISTWVSSLGMGETEAKERSTRWLPNGFEEFFGVSRSYRPLSYTASSDHNTGDAEGGCQYGQGGDINNDRTPMTNNININPYSRAVNAAVEVLELDLDQGNFLIHVCFARALDAAFREMLIQKDKKALLLLLYWYAKICDRRLWWLWKHAYIEGVAICRYLERAWTASGDIVGLNFLELPKACLMTVSGSGM